MRVPLISNIIVLFKLEAEDNGSLDSRKYNVADKATLADQTKRECLKKRIIRYGYEFIDHYLCSEKILTNDKDYWIDIE